MEKLQLPTSFHSNQARMKFSTGQCVKEVLCDIAPMNSCDLVLRWAWLSFKNTQSWWTFPLFEAWGTWNEVEIYDTKTSQEGLTYVEGENRKRRNINCRRKGNWRKRKGSKENDYGKCSRETRCLIEGHPCFVAFVYESNNNVVRQRLMEKLQLPSSFHSNQARMKFSTGQCVKEVLCDIAPMNSCPLVLKWAWLSFKNTQSWWTFPLFEEWGTWNEVEIYDTKTSQEGSTFVEGENRKRKNRKRRNINCRRKGNWRKRKGSKENDYGKGSREIRCLIEGHPWLVAFVYESNNNVVRQRLMEKLQLPSSFHSNQARMKFSTGQCVKEVLCDIAPMNSYILFWDGHSLILKHSILMNVPFIWGMRDMKWSWNLWHQD